MKTFEIVCIIYDKLNPSIEEESVIEIELLTTIQSESTELAIEKINNLYNIKEIINIQEVL